MKSWIPRKKIMTNENIFNMNGETVVRRVVQSTRISIQALPNEVKERIVWAAIETWIAYGNGDIESSECYASEALENLQEAMAEAERYGSPQEVEVFEPRQTGENLQIVGFGPAPLPQTDADSSDES